MLLIIANLSHHCPIMFVIELVLDCGSFILPISACMDRHDKNKLVPFPTALTAEALSSQPPVSVGCHLYEPYARRHTPAQGPSTRSGC